MADPVKPTIIIRRKKGGGHGGGHHGGAWKVAYADFVTAMMSFFLLLWLLNVTTADQRKGLADYFAPAGIAKSESGSGGVMGGQSLTMGGQRPSDSSTIAATEDRTIPTIGQGEEGDEDIKGKATRVGDGGEDKTALTAAKSETDEAALAAAMKKEEERFKETETALRKAIEGSPALQDLSQQIIIDRTPEGLRIQIVDREKFSMFPSGGAIPYERGRELMRLVGKVLARLPNKIAVSGHTDSTPFPAGSRRDNWTLSTDRATVCLNELVYAGVNDLRISRVMGMADREPLVIGDPKDPKNRRISIVLLRQTLPPAEVQQQPAAPSPPPAPVAAVEPQEAAPPPVSEQTPPPPPATP